MTVLHRAQRRRQDLGLGDRQRARLPNANERSAVGARDFVAADA